MNKTFLKLLGATVMATLLTVGMPTKSYAGVVQVDTAGLTTEQVNQLKHQAQAMKNDPATVSAKVRQEAEAWGDLGANMGKAMVGAARELGIAANEFATTPLGKVVVVMTAYKIAGRDILGVFVGSFIMLFGYGVAIWMFITHRWSKVKYEYEPVLWGAFKRNRIVSVETDEDTAQIKAVVGSLIILLSTLLGLVVIF